MNGILRIVGAVLLGSAAIAPARPSAPQGVPFRHTQYELLDAARSAFRITYDVTASESGATHYLNSIRTGSAASAIAVRDLATGEALEHEVVEGEQARERGHADAEPGQGYIRVRLARPVPEVGGARLRIEKTYVDPASYFAEGDRVVFARSLSIERNAVLLPAGHELLACNVPSQVLTAPDGRLLVSFFDTSPAPAPLRIEARRLPAPEGERATPPAQETRAGQIGSAPPSSAPRSPSPDYDFERRALQDRDIVYYLQQPETHAFRLFHDFTETRAGRDRYHNVVRPGSTVSDPEAWNLDLGERLPVETLRDPEAVEAELGRDVEPGTELVVVRFGPVPDGGSIRVRIWETYTDPGRYGLRAEELVWSRSFGRSSNALVLPAGWSLSVCSIPAVVSQTDDGRTRLQLDNPRPDSLHVVVRARRRP